MAWEFIELNICPTGDKPVFHAAQYDIGRPIIIALKNGEDDFTPTDLDIELQVRKVDNNIVTAVPDSVVGNVVTFMTTEQMTACSGTNLCELQLSSGDNTMATLHFFLVVQRDALQGGLSSQSEIHDLEEQIAAIVPEVIGDDYYTKEEVDEKIAEIPTFDPTNYYDKSDTDTLLSAKADTSSLSTVATTGDYDDLINKPTIPAAQVQSDWSQSDNTQVDYIKNKPTIPTSIVTTENIVSGAIASFNTNLPIPLNKLEVEIEPNLSGVSAVNVTRCGKNFLKYPYAETTKTTNNVTFTDNGNGSITINSTGASATTYFNMVLQVAPTFFKKGTYTISQVYTSNDIQFNIYNADGTLISSGYSERTFTLTEDVFCYYFLRVNSGAIINNLTIYPQLELGSTASNFEAYNGTTYTINLGESLTQGGSLNVTTGLLTRTDTTTSQLTPIQIKNLLINNIFADSGDIDNVTYYSMSLV